MKRHLLAASLAMSCLLGVALPASSAIVVSFSPTPQTVAGGPVTVDVNVSGLGTEVVSTFDFNIFFDASVLTATAVDFNTTDLGEEVAGDWDITSSLANAGEIDLFGFSWLLDDDLAAVQTDDAFRLMTITFAAVGDGVSNIVFGADLDFERNLIGRDALTLATTYGAACVAVDQQSSGTISCDNNAVPEPPSVALVALAMTGLAASLRRRRRSSTAA